jgi:hypothetical protein
MALALTKHDDDNALLLLSGPAIRVAYATLKLLHPIQL